MKAPSIRPVRCAIYTRVSTEHGLDQEFNSLDAQYDAASAYIKNQAHAGWAPDYSSGFPSGRLTSSKMARWVLSNQDSSVVRQTLQDA
jgi:DNA invertase Pin-like site-specific DNA recombinase